MVAFILAMIMALIATAVVAWGSPRRADWGPLAIFVLFFFLIWAGGVWVTPVGPPIWGVSWLPFLFVALLFALFWLALVPAEPPPGESRPGELHSNTPRIPPASTAVLAGVGVFFWALLLMLSVTVIAAYL